MFKKILVCSLLLLAGCASPAEVTDSSTPSTDQSTQEEQSVEVVAPPVEEASLTPKEMRTTPEKGDHIAVLKTSMGDIKILLYADQVAETVKNFEEIAKSGKYDDTIFHRVIPDFMIQGGDIENMGGYGGYSYKGKGTTIKDEFVSTLTNVRGALSMANSGPNTNGSQFFIVQAKEGTPWLNNHHTVFGFVYEGMDIVDKIAAVKTLPGDKPVEDIVLKGVDIETFK